MQDLPLADLDAFATVARMRNFRAAARVRGVSASSLSEAMRRLETRLGLRLLNRTTRSVTLTEAGQKLLDRLEPMLGEIGAAIEDINSLRDRPAGRLRLNVPGIVARLIMPDIACRFLTRYPDITLEVISDDSFVDVLAEGFDAGVRYEESLHQDMIAIPIGPRRQRYACVASPAYLEQHGTPGHPRDVLAHASIRHRFVSGRIYNLEFERDGEIFNIDPPTRVTADTIEMERAAAEAGLGLLFTFEDFLVDALAAGTLVRVLPDWTQSFSGPYLYFHSRKYMPTALRAFVDFVREDGASRPA